MIDAHFHRNGFATFMNTGAGREMRFFGIHPWQAAEPVDMTALRSALDDDTEAGVGEIGLDRLKTKTIPGLQRASFAMQLELAAELGRPAVLHGAKCWGEVVSACRPFKGMIPAFLFHGFSRSGGLIPAIIDLNGYISVGPALLNSHAVNYRTLARELPLERTLLETDMDYALHAQEALDTISRLHSEFAALRNLTPSALSEILDGNMQRFISRPR